MSVLSVIRRHQSISFWTVQLSFPSFFLMRSTMRMKKTLERCPKEFKIQLVRCGWDVEKERRKEERGLVASEIFLILKLKKGFLRMTKINEKSKKKSENFSESFTLCYNNLATFHPHFHILKQLHRLKNSWNLTRKKFVVCFYFTKMISHLFWHEKKLFQDFFSCKFIHHRKGKWIFYSSHSVDFQSHYHSFQHFRIFSLLSCLYGRDNSIIDVNSQEKWRHQSVQCLNYRPTF